MKKFIPHIIILLVVAAAIVLFFTGNGRSKRELDERLTFYRNDKIPYGYYVAYKSLNYIFPGATIHENRKAPGYWDSISTGQSQQALIIMAPRFDPDEFEMRKLITFIENGNDVFVSAAEISYDAESILHCQTSSLNFSNYTTFENEMQDSFSISLLHPPFSKETTYSYPGFQYSAVFDSTDKGTTEWLGKEGNQKKNFIHLRAGKGNLYLQLAPLAFSNYFLLHGNNIQYYENAFSLMNPNTSKVFWDEYYLHKKRERSSRSNLLNVLFRYPALAAALLTAIFTLLVYVLLEMRRKQRYIPIMNKPRNDSMDFVKTIGRLYFDKGDHLNLCRKMAAYFLEHIRNTYKLQTNKLDDEFIKNLKFKSGMDETEISSIINFIKKLDGAQAVSDKQLSAFHKQLESFYKNA